MSAVGNLLHRKQTSSTCSGHTHMRWVESGVQSGRYFAPMSRAFSLSSPRNGFWKPLNTKTTPSKIRLNGTCGKFSDLAFRCFGLGSGFFSTDLWAGEAADEQRLFREKHNLKAKVQVQTAVTFRGGRAGRAGWARLVFRCGSFGLRWLSCAHFLRRWRTSSRLPLFAELKFSFSWWLLGENNNFKRFSIQMKTVPETQWCLLPLVRPSWRAMPVLSRERHHPSAGQLQRKLTSDSEETLRGE